MENVKEIQPIKEIDTMIDNVIDNTMDAIASLQIIDGYLGELQNFTHEEVVEYKKEHEEKIVRMNKLLDELEGITNIIL